MKTIPTRTKLSFLAGLSAATLGSTAFAYATPQMDPESPADVAEFIQMELYHDQEMKGAEVGLTIENGIATLTGTASSLSQLERASTKVFANPEVLTVVNRIEINPAEEAAVLFGAKEMLQNQKLIDASGLKITASGTRIILDGEVGSTDEGELAREIVSETPGITAVENRLSVNFQSIRTDEQIASQLEYGVNDDPVYAGLDLKPQVKDGVVAWSGEVGTRQEYDRLVRNSYVTGVIEVEMSGLTINGDLAMEAVEDKNYSSSQSLEALTAAYKNDPRIKDGVLSAKITDGIVSLKGSVSSIEARDAAELTARSIPGVLEVSNKLTVEETSIPTVASPPLIMKPGRE